MVTSKATLHTILVIRRRGGGPFSATIGVEFIASVSVVALSGGGGDDDLSAMVKVVRFAGFEQCKLAPQFEQISSPAGVLAICHFHFLFCSCAVSFFRVLISSLALALLSRTVVNSYKRTHRLCW